MDEDLERLNTEVTMALAGLDARATQCSPRERAGQWSIQEIAEHLLLALEGSSSAIRERLQRARRRGAGRARGNARGSGWC